MEGFQVQEAAEKLAKVGKVREHHMVHLQASYGREYWSKGDRKARVEGEVGEQSRLVFSLCRLQFTAGVVKRAQDEPMYRANA